MRKWKTKNQSIYSKVFYKCCTEQHAFLTNHPLFVPFCEGSREEGEAGGEAEEAGSCCGPTGRQKRWRVGFSFLLSRALISSQVMRAIRRKWGSLSSKLKLSIFFFWWMDELAWRWLSICWVYGSTMNRDRRPKSASAIDSHPTGWETPRRRRPLVSALLHHLFGFSFLQTQAGHREPLPPVSRPAAPAPLPVALQAVRRLLPVPGGRKRFWDICFLLKLQLSCRSCSRWSNATPS